MEVMAEDDDNCGRAWNDPHPFGRPLKPRPAQERSAPSLRALEAEAPPAKRPPMDTPNPSRRRVTWEDEQGVTLRPGERDFSGGCMCGLAAALRRGAAEGIRSGFRRAARAVVQVVRLPILRRRRGGQPTASNGGAATATASPAPQFSLEDDPEEEFSPVAGAAKVRQLYRAGSWRLAPTGMVALCELDLTDLATTASWPNHRLDDNNRHDNGLDRHRGDGGAAPATGRWFHLGSAGHHIDLTAPTPAPTPRAATTAAATATSIAATAFASDFAAATAAAVAVAVTSGSGGGSGCGSSVSSCGPAEPATVAATFRLWAADSYNSSSSYSQTSPTASAAYPCCPFPVNHHSASDSAKKAAAAAAAAVMATAASLGRTVSLPPPSAPSALATAASLARSPPLGSKTKTFEEGTPLLLPYNVPSLQRSCAGR